MNWEEKIDRYMDEHKDDIAKTLSELVQCNTLNPGDPHTGNETAVKDYLIPKLNELGMETRVACVEENRTNVVGVMRGKGEGRDLLFNGHMDTVPTGDLAKWTVDPLGGEIKDGKVYGRGATDCKSGLCTSYWALRAIRDLQIPLKGDAYYIGSCGEESNEGGTCGIAATLTDDYKDPFCVVCEGSGFDILPTSVGLFYFELTVVGKPCHIGRRHMTIYPQNYGMPCGSEVGVDALQKALPYIDYFYRLERSWALRFRDPILGSGGYPIADKRGVGIFTINPVDIRGGMYFGSVIDAVTIKYGVWYPEFADREKLIEEIKAGVAAVSATDEWTRENPPILKIPMEQIWRGYKTDYDHEGIQLLKECYSDVAKQPASVAGMTAVSDATYVANKGIPVVNFGAGGGTNRVHGFDECAVIDELVMAAKMYTRMAIKWCGLAE